MKSTSLASAAIAALISVPAFAADMPRKVPPSSKPPTTCMWCGFYAGVNGGYGWAQSSGPITYFSPSTGFSGTANGLAPQGILGGAQIGYNYQINSVVLGIETDIQGASVVDSYNVTVTANNGTALVAQASEQLNWFNTVRGRAGLAFDHTLLYATGGFADGRVGSLAMLVNGGATALLTPSHTTRSGYTVGGGLEQYFTPALSVKAEYLYLDLGSETLAGISGNGVPLTETPALRARFNIVRIGFDYHFGN